MQNDDRFLGWQEERDLCDEIEWLRKIMFAARRVCKDFEARHLSPPCGRGEELRTLDEIKKDIEIVRGIS